MRRERIRTRTRPGVATWIVASAIIASATPAVPIPAVPIPAEADPLAPADVPSVVLVVGAPGEAGYGKEFDRWAAAWEDAARRGGADVTRIGPLDAGPDDDIGPSRDAGPDDDMDPAGASGAGGAATDRERLKAALEKESRRGGQPLWLVLIGHGTFDGRDAKLNLRGPDVSAAELAEWLRPCGRPLAVLNCASASGPFINALSAPNRAIVTATKSGFEHNYARFGGYLASALGSEENDIDKDGQISLLEAFLVASARTAEFYEEGARLATEHALIDDNGDGLGTPAEWFRGIRVARRAEGGKVPDGTRANQLVLVPGPAERSLPPELRLRRDELEIALARLREEKGSLDPETYRARLEALALELARLYGRIERAEVGEKH